MRARSKMGLEKRLVNGLFHEFTHRFAKRMWGAGEK